MSVINLPSGVIDGVPGATVRLNSLCRQARERLREPGEESAAPAAQELLAALERFHLQANPDRDVSRQ